MSKSLFDKLKSYNKVSIKTLQERSPKQVKNEDEDDDRFWNLKEDNSGSGSAIIKLLPTKELDGNDYIEIARHYFQKPSNKWIVTICPNTHGGLDADGKYVNKCPICEYNSELWSIGTQEAKDLASRRGKNRIYICNVLIIKDSIQPENEGKIFLWKFKRTMEKIIKAKFPKPITNKKGEIVDWDYGSDDDPLFNPFNLIESANLKLKFHTESVLIGGVMRKVQKYDQSSFSDKITPIKDESKIEKILSKCYDLKEVLGEDQYKCKTYDELKEMDSVENNATVISQKEDLNITQPTIESINTLLEKEEKKQDDEKIDFKNLEKEEVKNETIENIELSGNEIGEDEIKIEDEEINIEGFFD